MVEFNISTLDELLQSRESISDYCIVVKVFFRFFSFS